MSYCFSGRYTEIKQKLRESILTAAKRIEGWRAHDHCKACRRLVEVWRDRFDNRKACRRLVKARRVHFHYCKACRMPVEARRVGLTNGNNIESLSKFGESVFDNCKWSRRLVEALRICLTITEPVGGL